MTEIASFLERKNYILCSGGAVGADSAFEKGVQNLDMKRIFLPWLKFNGNNSPFYTISEDAIKLAKEFHPSWYRLSPFAKKLIARNGYQVLGGNLDSPVDFIICYTSNGKAAGGTGQALRIANQYNIPVYNLYFKEKIAQIDSWMDTGEISHIKNVRIESWKLM